MLDTLPVALRTHAPLSFTAALRAQACVAAHFARRYL